MKRTIFIHFILLFFVLPLFSQNVMLSEDIEQISDLNDYLYFLADETGNLTINQVNSAAYENKFIQFNNQKLKKHVAYWGRISFEIDKGLGSNYILKIGKKRDADFASFFLFENNILTETKQSGYFTKGSLKDIVEEHGSKIHLNIENQAYNLTVFFRIENISGFRPGFDVSLEKESYFNKELQKRNWIQGLIHGILWIMFLYNLFVFFMSRDKIYLYYSLYIIGVSVNFITEKGLLLENLLKESPDLNEYLFVFFTMILSVAYFAFLRNFLDTKKLTPFWDKVIQIFIIVNIIAAFIQIITISIWFNLAFVINFSNIVNLLNLIFGLIYILVLTRQRNKVVNYFIIGSVSLLVGTIASLGILMSEISVVFDPKYYMNAGTIGEILVFSLGLGYRIREIEKDRIIAQERLIVQLNKNKELQNQVNRELEEKVKYRTFEIEQQKEELEAQTERLAEINKELEKLSLVASRTDNLVVITDENAVIRWINEGFRDFAGSEFYKNLGKKLESTSSNKNIREIIEKSIRTNRSQQYITRTVSEDQNKVFWTQTTLTPILDRTGNLEKFIAIDSDITELKQAQLKITDSINYARRLQILLFPSYLQIRKLFDKSFVFFRAKDVVSGDFYMVSKYMNKKIVVVADSTGHGVPGAFMSIMGLNFINEILAGKTELHTNEILNSLREKVQTALSSDNDRLQDGMDISLIILDEKNKTLEFSGAHHPLYLLKNNEIEIVKGDKMPIGYSPRQEKSFTKHLIEYKEGETIYLFSDGFADQIGGKINRKYLLKRFRELLISISEQSMDMQYETLGEKFDSWKGSHSQLDDVTVMGIKL